MQIKAGNGLVPLPAFILINLSKVESQQLKNWTCTC